MTRKEGGTTTPHETPPGVASRRRRRTWPLVAIVVIVVGAAVVLLVFRQPRPKLADRIQAESGALAGWNVLLVSMDTVRRDRLHCYGRREIDTPVVDRLAREGVRFDQAVTPVPMTLPGHASMLTGLNPQHHGARVNGMFQLDEKVPTLAGTLRGKGYRTGAVIAAFVLDRRFGLARGFDHYDDDLSTGRQSFQFSYRERQADQVNAAAIQWLRQSSNKPFFLFVHYFDPHWPFNAPEPFASKYKNNDHGDYDGEIAYTDHQLGELLKELKRLGVRDRTLIAVTSDHGEGLGEHDEKTHSLLLYDTTLRVPLIVAAPSRIPQNRLVTRQVGLIDLTPTILDLLGVTIPTGLDGVSLLAPPPASPRRLYIETLAGEFMHGWAPLVGVRGEDYKFVLAPRPELYDLRADPNEMNDLFRSDRATASKLYDALKAMVGGDPELVTQVAANLPMDEDTRKRLGALGYLVTTTSPTTTSSRPMALPDPKDMIRAQARVQEAQTLMGNGQNREALLLLEPYITDHPTDGTALQVLGECYQRLGMLEQSLEIYRQATKQPFEKATAYGGVGLALFRLGRLDEAEAACRQALALEPAAAKAILTLGLICTERKQDDQAMAHFRRILEISRGTFDADAYIGMSRLHMARGDKAKAKEMLGKALVVDPDNRGAMDAMAELAKTDEDKQSIMAELKRRVASRPDPTLFHRLGQLEAEQNQHEQAVDSFRKAIELRGDRAETHHALARSLRALGKDDQSLMHLREAVRLDPKLAAAQADLGLALAQRNRLDEASKAFEQAVLITPDSAVRRYNWALILARMGNAAESETQLREAVRLEPNFPAAHYNLGLVLQMQGRNEEARKHLDRAIELNPKLRQAGKTTPQGAAP
ncbi:MAG: sulfatase-like hydrolase/transferase [Phycisphaerae bacterium]|nr:sulfatase-like hydrolase/transferase [Phycisphaerae bacterium]